MCDYSLHHLATRPARIEDKLVATKFPNSSRVVSRLLASRMLRSASCPAPKLRSTRMSNASRHLAPAFCQTRRSGNGSHASGKST